MSIQTLLQKACQLMTYWKILSISQGQLYHENGKKYEQIIGTNK